MGTSWLWFQLSSSWLQQCAVSQPPAHQRTCQLGQHGSAHQHSWQAACTGLKGGLCTACACSSLPHYLSLEARWRNVTNSCKVASAVFQSAPAMSAQLWPHVLADCGALHCRQAAPADQLVLSGSSTGLLLAATGRQLQVCSSHRVSACYACPYPLYFDMCTAQDIISKISKQPPRHVLCIDRT